MPISPCLSQVSMVIKEEGCNMSEVGCVRLNGLPLPRGTDRSYETIVYKVLPLLDKVGLYLKEYRGLGNVSFNVKGPSINYIRM